MKIIGLTGGIGSGKSTVARLLAELGAVAVDLDSLGHEALKQQEVRQQLVGEFGRGILTDSGEIDRARLGKLVFDKPEALKRLNRIVHPVIDEMVNARIERCRREGVEVVVLEAAAILEAGRAAQADELWVTAAPGEVVLERLTQRSGYSGEEARARIDAQMTGEERLKQADVVIDTNVTLEELRARVEEAWRKLQARL